ncbi:MAG: hypothetical protein EOM69_06315, partial [Clostridia bacterium]|nr:hypothetical protein [Clostridia bacterium]
MSHGIDYVPPKPLISRFVAPWDTSGWYYPAVDFAVGCKLYSNSDAVVLDAPKALWGGDYIVTFDSFTEGFDDKQGVTFTVEREARVYVALEQSAKGDFLAGFADAGEVLLASNRRVYRLLYRAYAQGEEVCLPGFEGACPHYTVIVCPLTADVPGPIPCPVYAKSVSQTHPSLPAAWQVHEVFCGMPLGDAPKDFTCQGDCRVAQWKREPRRRCVRLYAGASLQKSVKTGGSDIAELSVSVLSGKTTVSWCGAFITLERGHALLNGGLAVGQELGDRFRIRFVRHDGQCEVWLNCRVAGVLPCQKGQTGLFTMLVSQEGEAELELLSVRDQTSLPVWNERFTAPEKDWLFAPQTVIVRESLPFAAGKGLRIQGRGAASAVCPFPAMQGPVRIETTVKPTTKDFFILADVRDAGGAVALRVAMYCGNLYASNANQWERLTGGHISGLYYPCDNWFHLTLLIDLSRQRYDLVIDGAKRARDFHLACDARAIAQIGYQCPGAALSVGSLQTYDRLCSSDGMLPPTRVYDVTQAPYCARGDGKTLDTEAIQRALDDAAGTGGTVRLPRGVFLSGELFLRSDLTLWIDRGATLLGTQDHSQYPLMTPCDSLCAHRQLGRGLIYGEGVHNVRVTGGGTIDGNGRYRFKMNDPISDRERDTRPDQIYIACSDGVT